MTGLTEGRRCCRMLSENEWGSYPFSDVGTIVKATLKVKDYEFLETV